MDEYSIYLLHGEKSRSWDREETVYGHWIHSWTDWYCWRKRDVLDSADMYDRDGRSEEKI
jgi:hypothetical protein